ncbi:pimeloyl-ACP methyl ester carboxylesterase [Inhella inkyongensis]|uniref:Pimeloyl-ACP methyl ester carboxylesterase n=1 Tax=Inhella inkyongensis TaxID=392593 RepID=A0A840S164_9BURK|nr:alpha/beta fold hydrolase [Inhella inkyongensis]MBB5203262.1 pimeloyl-ACP methyl ester carboxylesterase [Inhella inkyongensis]
MLPSKFLLFFLSVLAAPGLVLAQPVPSRLTLPESQRQLEVLQLGEGQASVVLEAGFATGWSTWRKVLPGLAPQARLLAYSRAGVGASDPAPTVPTVDDRVRDLEGLLAASKLPPPYVLVGHSYGGLVVRAFAARHPEAVAALVLVDPASETYTPALRKIEPQRADADDAALLQRAPARFKAEYEWVMKALGQGLAIESRPLQQRPTVLLTSIKPEWPDLVAFTPAGREVWRQEHARWLAPQRNSLHWVTDVSGHHIQQEEPELVVQAVQAAIRLSQAEAQRQVQAQRRQQLEQGLAALKLEGNPSLQAEVDALLRASQLGEVDINGLGYRLLGQAAQRSLAQAVLVHNAVRFPQSVNAQDSLGEALLKTGQGQAARAQFAKALELARQQSASARQIQAIEANLRLAEALK